MRYVKFSLLIGCALFAASPLSASVLVAGTNPDSTGLDFVSDAPGPDGVFSLEQLFTLSTAAHVTSLEINAASFSSQTLRIELFSGLGLEGTGTLLQTFNVSIPGGFDGMPLDIPTIMVSTSLMLGSGSYSLLFSDPNPSSDLIYLNAALSSNTPDGSLGGTNWSTGITGADNLVFELDGTVNSTPEPASMWLLGIGLFGVACGRAAGLIVIGHNEIVGHSNDQRNSMGLNAGEVLIPFRPRASHQRNVLMVDHDVDRETGLER
jgi:hypothetical protein